MKFNYLKSIFILSIIFISKFGFTQLNDINVKFIGNCGLYMTDGNLNIYFDFPYKSGAFGYMEYDQSELDSIKDNSIFIFTHKHPDHYSGKNMRKTLKNKNGKKYGKWNISKLENLANSTANFSIQAFKTGHRFSFRHYSYLITWHGKKIFISGDTETADTILKVSNMDWAFVPSWIVHDANEKGIKIDSKMIGIYHLYPDEVVVNNNPDKIKIFDKQGETISISSE